MATLIVLQRKKRSEELLVLFLFTLGSVAHNASSSHGAKRIMLWLFNHLGKNAGPWCKRSLTWCNHHSPGASHTISLLQNNPSRWDKITTGSYFSPPWRDQDCREKTCERVDDFEWLHTDNLLIPLYFASNDVRCTGTPPPFYTLPKPINTLHMSWWCHD